MEEQEDPVKCSIIQLNLIVIDINDSSSKNNTHKKTRDNLFSIKLPCTHMNYPKALISHQQESLAREKEKNILQVFKATVE